MSPYEKPTRFDLHSQNTLEGEVVNAFFVPRIEFPGRRPQLNHLGLPIMALVVIVDTGIEHVQLFTSTRIASLINFELARWHESALKPGMKLALYKMPPRDASLVGSPASDWDVFVIPQKGI